MPESIYLHLLDDQQQGKMSLQISCYKLLNGYYCVEYGDVFKDKRIRERQLFISLSCQDLRPLEASLFRLVVDAKCNMLVCVHCVEGSVKFFS